MNTVDKKIELAINILNIVVLTPGGSLIQKYFFGLIQQTKDKNVKITAILPQSKEEADLEIKQFRLNSLNVGGTPAIIAANDKGEISDL